MTLDYNAVYVKSPFMQVVREGDSAVIWHSLFGNPKVVSVETIDFLNEFSIPTRLLVALGQYISNIDIGAIEELINGYFIVPDRFDEREFLNEKMREREQEIINGSRINYLELIMSEECNFRCVYCIHFNNLRKSNRINNSKKFMCFDIAKEIIDWYLEILRNHGKRVSKINFGGGEPLLVWPVILRILEYCEKTHGLEFEFHFSINTNASLITSKVAESLKRYQIKISSSLDGFKKDNDLVRMTKSGNGTFNSIIKGFNALDNIGYPLDGFTITINERNFHLLNNSIIDWAFVRGMNNLRIDIDVINIVEMPMEDIVNKLIELRSYAYKRGVNVCGFWSRPAENLNESALETVVAFCGAIKGSSICVNPSGSIYMCGYSNIEIGKFSEVKKFPFISENYFHFVRDHMSGKMEMCKGCIIEGQCGGGCNITHEFAHTVKSVKIERMCVFYRRMTKEIIQEQLLEVISQTELVGDTSGKEV